MANRLQTGTTRGQRLAIWIILILTVVSTVALYAATFLQQKNTLKDTKNFQAKLSEYNKARKEYTEKTEQLASQLSAKYFSDFKAFEKAPTGFNASDVKELKTHDHKIGDGEEITDKSTEFYAYYIGWKPDGTTFDSSFNGNSGLKTPIAVKKNGGKWPVIEGWSEGVKGMRIGGIRELTIPADKAYGVTGSEDKKDSAKNIPPNTPLKFVIMLVPKFEEIPEPNYRNYLGE